MWDFGLRNLKLFFKDTAAVALSFLAEAIVVVLYALFIRDQLLAEFSKLEGSGALLDVWMISGILGITSVTTTMGAYGILVSDRSGVLHRDFDASPIGKPALLGGYMVSAVSVGVMTSLVMLAASGAYVRWRWGIILGAGHLVSVCGTVVLAAVANSAMVLFLVSFLKSSNALAGCCTILGALLGFLTGIYLPQGSLPERVRTLVACFPASHGVVLFRRLLMENLVEHSFDGAESALAFERYMGVRLYWSGREVRPGQSMAVLAGTAIFFTLLALANLARNRE